MGLNNKDILIDRRKYNTQINQKLPQQSSWNEALLSENAQMR